MKREITRRDFLRLSAVTAVGAVVSACAAPAPTATSVPPTKAAVAPTSAPITIAPPMSTSAPVATAAPAVKYTEAPMLADLVKSGKLPAIAERLPKNPWVVASYEGVGKHGGTWRRAFQGVSDYWGPTKLVDRAWAWFDKNLNLIPRLLESWEVNKDGTVWTCHMRPGIKWSDGKDYTTDDIDYWYKNELQNKKLSPQLQPQWSSPDKTLVKFEAVDKYTAKFTYTKPAPLFMYGMTRGGTGGGMGVNPGPFAPGYYMKQFHEDLTSDKAALEADIKKRGFADWVTYYTQWARVWCVNTARPVLGPWLAKNELSNQLLTIERNPYFFAVDPQGNQLPYIDKVTFRLFQSASPEVFTLWVTNGEIDMQFRHTQLANLALYKASEAKGDYKVILGKLASHFAIQLNLTTKNKPLAEFFNQRNARIAISQAINRDNINQLVFNGLLTPRQYSPMMESPQYYEKLTNAYIKYDPDAANKLLDEAGYTKKDANGIRLFRDGSGPISFSVEGTDAIGTQSDDAMQLVTKDLAKIGIKATYKFAERSLYTQHYTANDIEAAWWGGDRTLLPLVTLGVIFRGLQSDRPWCNGWGFWYLNPQDQNAVEPPKDHWIRNIWKIWDEEVSVEVDPAKATAAFKKLLDIWATELPMIAVLGNSPATTIIKNGFKGYPAGMPNDDPAGDEHFCSSETYYWDDPSKHSA
jgi:peptide/nickel transport system substrate-binding protein